MLKRVCVLTERSNDANPCFPPTIPSNTNVLSTRTVGDSRYCQKLSYCQKFSCHQIFLYSSKILIRPKILKIQLYSPCIHCTYNNTVNFVAKTVANTNVLSVCTIWDSHTGQQISKFSSTINVYGKCISKHTSEYKCFLLNTNAHTLANTNVRVSPISDCATCTVGDLRYPHKSQKSAL